MTTKSGKPTCGIVMPISEIDGCSEIHWTDVLAILSEAIELAGFEGELVSNADDVGIIQKRIIQNLYDNPVVVCDVSGKNPNVMFELGIRLAFDKPTIIVKDDKTSYSFDTAAIEHLEYPRDLRFNRIVEFKRVLSDKIKATHDKAEKDPEYTTFLKHFGEFKVAKLEKREVSGQEYIIDELRGVRQALVRLERRDHLVERPPPYVPAGDSQYAYERRFSLRGMSSSDAAAMARELREIRGVSECVVSEAKDRVQVRVQFNPDVDNAAWRKFEKKYLKARKAGSPDSLHGPGIVRKSEDLL